MIEDTAGYFDELYGGNWHVVIDPDYPETEEERDEAVERAEKRIGEEDYNLISNNCETLVTEVLKPGQGCSHQATNAMKYVRKVVRSSVASSAVIAALPVLMYTQKRPSAKAALKLRQEAMFYGLNRLLRFEPQPDS